MKNIKNILYISPIALLFIGCAGGNNPGIEYAPDMYDAKSYEPYSQIDSNTLNDLGSNLRKPVDGTVALGKNDYAYNLPNNGEGYSRSATEVTMPAGLMDPNCEGKRLYAIYCSPCHGDEGKNDGKVFQRATTLKPGAWADGYQNEYIKNLPVGQIYHTLVYGKNNMGSHASVLTPTERWQVIAYVKQLSNGNTVCNPSSDNNSSSTTDASSTESNTDAEEVYEEVEISAEERAHIQKDLEEIQFETGSDKLKASSVAALDDLAETLHENDGLRFIVEGHTDNTGDETKNRILSQQRAESVVAYLIGKGYTADRFIAKGYGSAKPLDNGDSEEAKARNRRVEFKFTK